MSALDRPRRIEKRRAVLGDVDRRIAVALLDPAQRVGQPLREDLPARLGVRRPLLADAAPREAAMQPDRSCVTLRV